MIFGTLSALLTVIQYDYYCKCMTHTFAIIGWLTSDNVIADLAAVKSTDQYRKSISHLRFSSSNCRLVNPSVWLNASTYRLKVGFWNLNRAFHRRYLATFMGQRDHYKKMAKCRMERLSSLLLHVLRNIRYRRVQLERQIWSGPWTFGDTGRVTGSPIHYLAVGKQSTTG